MSQDDPSIPPVPPAVPEAGDGFESMESIPPVPPAEDPGDFQLGGGLDGSQPLELGGGGLDLSGGGGGLNLGGGNPLDLSGPTLGDEDEAALGDIGQHTTKRGRIAAGALIAGVLAVGGWGYYVSTEHGARMERLDQIGAISDHDDMVQALREYLPDAPHADVKVRILMNLGHFQDAESVPAIIAELQHGGIVRRAAAHALAEIGLPAAESAKEPLLAVLPDCDEVDTSQVVWALATLRESRAADAVLEMFQAGRLQELDGFSPQIVVEVLGPERLASDDLIGNDSPAIRVLTAHALAEGEGSDVVEPLTRMLQTELERPEPSRDNDRAENGRARNAEVIRAVTAGLGRTGDARAARPLFNVMTNEPTLRAQVHDSLRRAASGPQLVNLLSQARDRDVVLALTQMLAQTHDARVADTLFEKTTHEDEEIRAVAALGLAELEDPRSAAPLLAVARARGPHSDDAYQALENVATAAEADGLEELLEERPARRSNILRAMGHTGDTRFVRMLVEQLDDTDAMAAARALADLDADAGYQRMMRIAERPRDVNMRAETIRDRTMLNHDIIRKRKAALTGIARFGRSECVEQMMEIVEDSNDDYEMRELAAAAIGLTATDEQMSTVIGRVTGASVPRATKRYYASAFWQKPRPALNGRLLDLAGRTELHFSVRRAAALAVGYAADPANDEALIRMLRVRETERGAALAITLGGGPAAVTALMERLGNSRELSQVLQDSVLGDEKWFSVMTEGMLRGGLMRRVRAAHQLREGVPNSSGESYSYAWNKVLEVMRNGWYGPSGATRLMIRSELWNAVSDEDPQTRALAASVMKDLPERGLLLRARDAGGEAGAAARAVLEAEQRGE